MSEPPALPDRPMKYIVFETPRGEAPVLFPHDFTHSWVAGELRPMRPISAGFLEMTAAGEIRCAGAGADDHRSLVPRRRSYR